MENPPMYLKIFGEVKAADLMSDTKGLKSVLRLYGSWSLLWSFQIRLLQSSYSMFTLVCIIH